MPIHVSWGNEEKTFTIFRFENKWTWEEFYHSIDAAHELVRNSAYIVNTLVDVAQCHLFPQNLLSNVRSVLQQPIRDTDLIVVVTTSRFIEMLLHTLEKLYDRRKLRFEVVSTLQAGMQLMAEYDRQEQISSPFPIAASESAPVPAALTSLPE